MLALFMSMEHKMNNEYVEKIVNVQTGEETFREYTADEIKQVEAAKIKQEQLLQEMQQKTAARQAVYLKLGLTSDEVDALFK
jgi:hypothetical protein